MARYWLDVKQVKNNSNSKKTPQKTQKTHTHRKPQETPKTCEEGH